jgi:hypothetical protein
MLAARVDNPARILGRRHAPFHEQDNETIAPARVPAGPSRPAAIKDWRIANDKSGAKKNRERKMEIRAFVAGVEDDEVKGPFTDSRSSVLTTFPLLSVLLMVRVVVVWVVLAVPLAPLPPKRLPAKTSIAAGR